MRHRSRSATTPLLLSSRGSLRATTATNFPKKSSTARPHHREGRARPRRSGTPEWWAPAHEVEQRHDRSPSRELKIVLAVHRQVDSNYSGSRAHRPAHPKVEAITVGVKACTRGFPASTSNWERSLRERRMQVEVAERVRLARRELPASQAPLIRSSASRASIALCSRASWGAVVA